jgi:S-formylglutathione hydrolase FrmB
MHWIKQMVAASLVMAALGAAAPAVAAGLVENGLLAPSPTLGHPIKFSVYRPFPAPDGGNGERWPVVYLLHGLTGQGADWFSWGNLGPILDRALADGKLGPMLVVAPDGGDSWYVDDPDPKSSGLVETAFATDLIAYIDKTYPTAACRTGRVIGGLSMGGYGAIREGIDHPELFAAIIGMSPAVHPPLVANDPRVGWIRNLFTGVFGKPFDAARFNAANPFTMVKRLRAVKDKPPFYLTIGDHDHADLIEATVAFHGALRNVGADSTLRIGAGRHYWDTWQQAIVPALQWASLRLDPSCGRPPH